MFQIYIVEKNRFYAGLKFPNPDILGALCIGEKGWVDLCPLSPPLVSALIFVALNLTPSQIDSET